MTVLQTLEMALKDLEDANNTAYAEFSIDNLYGETITKLRTQIALEKKAENERELGIQMHPDEPVALQMDVIVVNLVRAGINKHHARELAEHFIKHTRPQPAAQFAGSYGTIDESAAKRIAIALGWEPKREWVALTQQDIDIAFDDTQEGGGFNEFARAIEQRLKEKNT